MSRVVRGSTHALTARPPTSAQATPSAARSAKVRAMSVLSGVTGAGVAMPQGGLGHLRAQRPGAPGARLERQPRCRGPRRPGAVAAGAVGPSRRRPRGTRAPARSVAEWRTWCQGGPSTACCERAAAADRGASSGTLAAARTAGKDRERPGRTGKDREGPEPWVWEASPELDPGVHGAPTPEQVATRGARARPRTSACAPDRRGV